MSSSFPQFTHLLPSNCYLLIIACQNAYCYVHYCLQLLELLKIYHHVFELMLKIVHEKIVWQQYARNGMQGPTSLSKISSGGYYGTKPSEIPYYMAPINGIGVPPVGGYYYTPY